MATASIQTNAPAERVAFGKIPAAIAFAGGISAVVNTLIFFIANSIGGMKVPMLAVPIASIVAVAVGGLLYALLGKLTKRPITIFVVVSVLFLLVSFFSPYNATLSAPMPGAEVFNTTTFVATEIMHLFSGVLAIYAFTRRARAA